MFCLGLYTISIPVRYVEMFYNQQSTLLYDYTRISYLKNTKFQAQICMDTGCLQLLKVDIMKDSCQ